MPWVESSGPRPPRFGRRAFIGLGAGFAALAAAGAGWLARREPSPSSSSSAVTAVPVPSSPTASPDASAGPNSSGEPASAGPPTASEPGKAASAPEPEPAAASGSAESSEPSVAAEPPVIPPDAATPGVLAVGVAYLRLRPHEADTAVLMEALAASGPDPVAAAGPRIASDFAAGRTVQLDGWVLSESEARAAAVVSLVCPSEC